MDRRLFLAGASALALPALVGVSSFLKPSTALASDPCSCGWEPRHGVLITQCCTLVCSDFPSEEAFKAALRDEGGWGKLAEGRYIMWEDGHWHESTRNEDHSGNPMRPDTLAGDDSFIPLGTRVCLPGGKLMTMRDTGPSYRGAHVNYLIGEGRAACAAIEPIENATIWLWVGSGEPRLEDIPA